MTIQEILEAHDDLYFNNQNNKFYCDCGLELGAKRKAYYVMDSTHRAHVAEVLDKHMQEREVQAVRYANQSIVDSIDLPDTYIYVDHLTEYANRMEPTNGR